MHDLLFTIIGDDYPFRAAVRVHAERSDFEFVLSRGGSVVSADRCAESKISAVLDALLLQLVAE